MVSPAFHTDRGTEMQLSSPSGRSLLRYALVLALPSALAVAASCARAPRPTNEFGDDGGNPSGDDSSVTIFGDATVPPADDSGFVFLPDGSTNKCNPTIPCRDFPDPQFEGTAPMNAGSLFGDAGTGVASGGPCLAEPADGALYPKNWLRPRVLWTATSSQTLFEVRVHADGEVPDYVVYTTNHSWTMPKDIWQTIAWTPPQNGMMAKDGNLMGRTLTVTVRGMGSGGGPPAISNAATFTIAPAIADGALIYWSTASFANASNNTALQGFHVGDEGTTTALTADQVQQPVRAQSVDGGNLLPAGYNGVFCIGCHAATPDGNYVSFTSQWPWANALASVQSGEAGAAPPWLSHRAITNLSPNINGYYQPPTVNQVMMGIQTFSPAHYQTGDRRLVAAIGAAWNQTQDQIKAMSPGAATGVTSQLAWFDLEYAGAAPEGGAYNPWGSGLTTSPLPLAVPCTSMTPGVACATSLAPTGGWGIVARTGDSNSAGAPNWSHNVDGMTDVIAYGSTNLGTKDGRMDCQLSGPSCTSDVYVVPYAAGQGGTASGLPGASDPGQNEYYPAWSPDDQLIAFNRVPKGTSMYNEPKAEVYVVPYNKGAGGTAVRLSANDPVSCTGVTPGTVQNTWPKWAPNPLDATTQKPVPQKDGAGNTYYWITFSSIRSPTAQKDPANNNKARQQLYVVGVVVAPDGTINSSYAPIYLWNQDFTVNNLIPAWGEFSIPPGRNPPPDAGGIF
jgi:hypothetical protein